MKAADPSLKCASTRREFMFPVWVFMLLLQFSASALPTRLGDLDGDGRATVFDMVVLINHIRGTAPLSTNFAVFADVNQDGQINQTDAALLAEMIVGRTQLMDLPLATVLAASPANGESAVSVSRRTFLTFTEPLAVGAVIPDANFYATAAGRKLLTRVQLSSDCRTVTLFYQEPLPGGVQVQVVFDGTGIKDFIGRAVDPDGDGQPGGVRTFNFTTLSLATVTNTAVCGRVFASQLQPVAGSTNQFVNTPLAGVTVTVDGQEQNLRAVTDALGDFRLSPVPAGEFFVHIDGRTVTNLAAGIEWPSQAYYPYVGKRWVSVAQQEVNIGEIYLPLVPAGTLKPISLTNDTVLQFSSAFVSQNPQFAGVAITVPPGDLYSGNGLRGGSVGIAPVPPSRLPGPLPPGLPLLDVVTIQTDGPGFFDVPVAACFPNLDGLLPGEKSSLLSFNHETGQWEVEGSMTVSDDGKLVCTDPGVGIVTPGWHGAAPYTQSKPAPVTTAPTMANSKMEKGTASRPPAAPLPEGVCPLPWADEDSVVDPVYLFSGEFYYDSEDLRIKGRGLDFVWARKYRSQIGPNTPQGNRWDFSYNVYLQQQGTNIVLNDGNTRSDVYTLKPDGTWSQREFFRQLAKNQDGSFTMVFDNGGAWNFAPLDGTQAGGKLSSSADRNGNHLQFQYDHLGRLTNVIDTLGRNIAVFYNDQGMIAGLADFAGRMVKYSYYGAGEPGGNPGDLKSCTMPAVLGTPNGNDFPDGKTTTYTYSTGQANDQLDHNILTITDPRRNDPADPTFGQGPYVINTYAPTTDPNDPVFNHVMRQVWGGGVIDMTYVSVLPSNANGNAVSETIVRDRNGHVREYVFDAGNRVVRRRIYTGHSDTNQPVTLTSNRPTGKLRPSDPDFFESTYSWNDDSLEVQAIGPNGNITKNIYESDLNPDASVRSRGNLRKILHLPGTHTPAGDQAVIEEDFEYDTAFGAGCCGFNFVTRHTDGRGNDTFYSYDSRGNQTQIRHRIASMVEDFEYNQFGQLAAHVLPANASGNRRRDELKYYSDGPMTGYLQSRIADAGGFAITTSFQYDVVGNVTNIIDPRGHSTTFVVNALNQTVRTIEPEVTDGSGIRYLTDSWYDANDNVVRIDLQNVDDLGIVQPKAAFSTRYEYESLNYLTRVVQDVSATNVLVVDYQYDANRNRTLIRFGEATAGRQANNVVRRTFDERDLPFQVTRAPGDPGQSTSQIDYDGNGNTVASIEGLEGSPHVRTSTYDAFDRLVSEVDPMGNVQVLSYDANNQVVREIRYGELQDIKGGGNNIRLTESGFGYDAEDRRVSEQRLYFDPASGAPIGKGSSTKLIVFDDAGDLVQQVDDNGRITRSDFDTANRTIEITDPKGNSIQYAYDPSGNVVSVIENEKSDLVAPDQSFLSHLYYDNLNRLVRTEDAAGNIVDMAYDSRHHVTWLSDAQRTSPAGPGNVTRFVYDGASRLVRTTRYLTDSGVGGGNIVGTIDTDQLWDDSSRLIQVSDGNGNSTKYQYDPLNRATGVIYADGSAELAAFDLFDNVVHSTRPNGTVRSATFDALNRPVRYDYLPGPGISSNLTFESFTFDGASRLVVASNNVSQVLRRYDSLADVTSETQTGIELKVAYDGEGNQVQLTYPNGRGISQVFDELGRLQSVADDAGVIATFNYVGPGRVAKRSYRNGTASEFTYDGMGKNPTGDFGFKQMVQSLHKRIADQSVIDQRLYTWDRAGNKISYATPLQSAVPKLFKYDSTSRLVQGADAAGAAVGYAFDADGNRTSVSGGADPGIYSLAKPGDLGRHAALNEYASTPAETREYDGSGNLTGIGSVKVVYDAHDRPVSIFDGQGTQLGTYQYDTLGRRISKTTSNGAVTYYYNGWREIEERDASGRTTGTSVYGNSTDEVLTRTSSEGEFFYYSDDLGSITAVADGTGRVLETYDYDDYGKPTVRDGAGVVRSQSAIGNDRLFTGNKLDPESGWYYYKARYLDPEAGRFVTRDPIGAWTDGRNSGNAFSYAGNNPRTLIDPFGFKCRSAADEWKAAKDDVAKGIEAFQKRETAGFGDDTHRGAAVIKGALDYETGGQLMNEFMKTLGNSIIAAAGSSELESGMSKGVGFLLEQGAKRSIDLAFSGSDDAVRGFVSDAAGKAIGDFAEKLGTSVGNSASDAFDKAASALGSQIRDAKGKAPDAAVLAAKKAAGAVTKEFEKNFEKIQKQMQENIYIISPSSKAFSQTAYSGVVTMTEQCGRCCYTASIIVNDGWALRTKANFYHSIQANWCYSPGKPKTLGLFGGTKDNRDAVNVHDYQVIR